jgi:DNA-binding PadR family transcriptional regulator
METCGYAWFSGTPWPGRSFLDPDELRLALLSLLAEPPETPMHGYQLMKRLEEHSGGVYRARAGTVYPILQQLEDESLIVSELREGKKVYVLTEEGKRELAQKREAVQRIWRRSRRWEDWSGAFAEAERVVKQAFRAMAGEGSAEPQIERVREILRRALRELEELGRSQ